MTDREKLVNALGKTAWAYVFLYFKINLFGLTLLPDWIGWLLLWNALLVLPKEVPTARLLQTPAQLLLFWEAGSALLGWLGLDVSLGRANGLLGAAALVLAALYLYVNFQLFTDLALLADRFGCSQGRHLRVLRVIHLLVPTTMTLPYLQQLEWFYWLAAALQMIGLVWTCVTLFSLRKTLAVQNEASE